MIVVLFVIVVKEVSLLELYVLVLDKDIEFFGLLWRVFIVLKSIYDYGFVVFVCFKIDGEWFGI